MKKRLLFWVNGFMLHFGLAYYLQQKLDDDFYAVIDVPNNPKKMFLNQKIVDFQKTWYFHDYIKKTNTEILVSWHNFKKTPSIPALKKMYKQMRKFSKNIKIVTNAKTHDDSTKILSLYSNSTKTNLVAFAMGDEGRMSRILCLYLGAPFTYVSLGKPVAPGQFSLDQVKRIIRV